MYIVVCIIVPLVYSRSSNGYKLWISWEKVVGSGRHRESASDANTLVETAYTACTRIYLLNCADSELVIAEVCWFEYITFNNCVPTNSYDAWETPLSGHEYCKV